VDKTIVMSVTYAHNEPDGMLVREAKTKEQQNAERRTHWNG